MPIEIIPTSYAQHLAKILSKDKGFNINYLQDNKDGKKFFPDGETYVKLNDVCKNKSRIIVLHSGAPEPNNGLIELDFILGILKNNKSGPVELFLAYFPYCRQDAEFCEGEANIVRSLLEKWTKFYKVKKIYVIDAHFAKKTWAKNYPVKYISASDFIFGAVKSKYPDIVFMAPDEGGAKRASLQGLSKERKNSFDVSVGCSKNFGRNIQGKIVGVADDIIGTGGTMVCAGAKFKEVGAKKIIAIATHGVLESGIERVKKAYDDLFLANTINCKNSNIDISKLISKTLLK